MNPKRPTPKRTLETLPPEILAIIFEFVRIGSNDDKIDQIKPGSCENVVVAGFEKAVQFDQAYKLELARCQELTVDYWVQEYGYHRIE